MARVFDSNSVALPIALEKLEVDRAVTDGDGVFTFASVPQMALTVTTPKGYWRLAMRDGDGVRGLFSIVPKSKDDVDRGGLAVLPQIYFAPEGKGSIWHPFTKIESGEPLDFGTVLAFSAKKNLNDFPEWNPNLKFEVTVGAGGMVKTPLVVEGEYAIRSIKGSPYAYDYSIEGMGSVLLLEALTRGREKLHQAKPTK